MKKKNKKKTTSKDIAKKTAKKVKSILAGESKQKEASQKQKRNLKKSKRKTAKKDLSASKIKNNIKKIFSADKKSDQDKKKKIKFSNIIAKITNSLKKTKFQDITNGLTNIEKGIIFLGKNSRSAWGKILEKKKSKADKKTSPKNKSKNKIPKPDSFAAKHPKITLTLRIIFFPILNPIARYFLLLIFIVGLAGILYILRDLPSPRRLTSTENYPVSTQIFDRNGKLLYEIFGNEHRIPIKLETLPPHVYQASIAIEDKNFYKHWGFDIEGIARAIRTNIQGDGSLHGGSTITQQLVKNALLTPEKSIKRKVKEGILAIFTEALYSKEEILEMYMNYISYGGTSVGIQAAAQSYFDKNASELTLAEAALLAGLPQAPSRYSPFGSDPKKAKDRQAEVLRRMEEDGYITKIEAEQAKAEVLNFALSKTEIKAPHFVFYVRDILYEEYGEENVKKSGLRVYTTLDLDLQEVAQASLSAEVNRISARYRVSNGAAMITKPNTGEILAMIGSKDYFNATDEGEVNVTISERQPGSSIKPLVYATAFQEKTLNPGTMLLDIPTCFEIPNQKPYCPKNYDGTFKGPVTVRQGLGNSLNITAVKAISTIGVEKFMKQARKMGLETLQDPSRYGLSLSLGGGEVKLIDMTQSFGVLANQGVKVPLTPFLRIEDYKGNIIEKVEIEERIKDLDYLTNYESGDYKGELERVMDRAPAYMASHILQDNDARKAAFGARSELVIPGQVVSVKTGTTNDMRDNWTIGYTPEFLVAVWVGNNDNSPMSYIASGVTGAAPIFNDIMVYTLQDQDPIWQEKPADVQSAPVCASGLPPAMNKETCSTRVTELYWEEGKPSNSKVFKQQTWIKPETGLPPAAGESQDGLVLEERTIYQDPVTEFYCGDCNRAVDDQGKTVYERHSVDSQEVLNKVQEMMR